MSTLNKEIKEQTANYNSRMKEIELLNLPLSGANLDGKLKEMLEVQRDSIKTIDPAHFSTLYQPVQKAPTLFKKLITETKENAPEMGVKAAKSGAKSLLKKVPLIEGIVDAAEVLIRGKFKLKSFPEAAKVLVADAAEEIPVVGKSFKHLIKSINLTNKKAPNSKEASLASDDSANGISVNGILKDTKKQAPEMVRIVAKSELKKALREIPLADGIVNAGAIMTEKNTKQKELRAGQALFADAAGEIPFVGDIAESLIKKINLSKLNTSNDRDEIVDDIYFVKKKENNPQQPQMENVDQNISMEASTALPKAEPLQIKNNITQHLRQLRGQESSFEKFIVKKTKLDINYARTAYLTK